MQAQSGRRMEGNNVNLQQSLASGRYHTTRAEGAGKRWVVSSSRDTYLTRVGWLTQDGGLALMHFMQVIRL